MNGFCEHNRPLVDFICAKKILIICRYILIYDIWKNKVKRKYSCLFTLLPLNETETLANESWLLIPCPDLFLHFKTRNSNATPFRCDFLYDIKSPLGDRSNGNAKKISKTSFKISITILAAPLRLPPLHGGTIKICSSTWDMIFDTMVLIWTLPFL